MIRPIDTQILHPQTPEIAGRQQKTNHLPVEQQSQFGDIMKKEVEHKKDTVVESQNPANLKADKDGTRQPGHHNKKKSKKKSNQEDHKKNKNDNSSRTRIDIRI